MDLNELERHFARCTPRIKSLLEPRIPETMRGKFSAEDILQDVWMLASRHADRFMPKGEHSPEAWLRQIARNALADRIKERQRAKRSGRRNRVGGAIASSILNALEITARAERTPSQGAKVNEVAACVRAALMELPDNRRHALWMKYIDGVSTGEIAERMGKTESAVRSLIAEGLKQLKRIMGDAGLYFSDADESDPPAT